MSEPTVKGCPVKISQVFTRYGLADLMGAA
jgi:hypothetical protein